MPGVKTQSKQQYISELVRRGYVVRSFRNPDNPHYKISFRSHPVFIRLTPSGIALITGIEKDLYKLLLNTSLNDLTGVNNKKAK